MKVRAVRPFRGNEGRIRVGDVIEVNDRRAAELQGMNLVVPDVGAKSVRAPKNKMEPAAASNKRADGTIINPPEPAAAPAAPTAAAGDGLAAEEEQEAEVKSSTRRRSGSRTGGKRVSPSSSRAGRARKK